MKQRTVIHVGSAYRTNPISQTQQSHTVIAHYRLNSKLYDNIKNVKAYVGKLFAAKNPNLIAVDVDGERHWTSTTAKMNDQLLTSLNPENFVHRLPNEQHPSSQGKNSSPF